MDRPARIFFAQMNLVGLEMVQAAFLAPRFGRKVAVVGSIKYFTPNIDICALLTPQKRENSPQAIINQKNLIDTEKPYKLKISCGQSL